ncbi:MAG: hypothetical protein NTZ78_02630 [Candidatus Aureabacteria bacterium]|nr:hypothetical protein [Candidatus Auribacterota bacterium]
MKKLITVALSLMLMVGLSCVAIAGSIEPSGPPTAGSGMYTLQNLYDYLTSGAALTVQSSFEEPSAAPTTGTMKTTKEIGDAIAGKFSQCNVTADNVELGKTFFCTQPGSWGVQTGTLVVPPTPTPTPTITPTIPPTPTPTWGLSQCAAAGGLWRATQFPAPNDYGCWFTGAKAGGQEVNVVCADKGLRNACEASLNFNDSTGCDVCKEFYPGNTCAVEPGSNGDCAPIRVGTGCWRRPTGSTQLCHSTCDGYGGTSYPVSVCVPK